MKSMSFATLCLALFFASVSGRALTSDDCLSLLGRLLEKPTGRVKLRPVKSREDAQRLRQILSHPRMASFSDREVTLASIEESVEDHLWGTHHISAYDSLAAYYGVYVGSELAGTAKLMYYPKSDAAAIAYGISPDQQRRGLATEAAKAMVEFAFDELEVDYVFAAIADSNKASIRVVEKLGFFRGGEVVEGLRKPSHYYRLSRKIFLDQRANAQ